MKRPLIIISICIFCLTSGLFTAHAEKQKYETPAFFGTLFSSATPQEIREGLEKLGARKAGKIEMGDLLQSAPYFHFIVPRTQLEATLGLLKSSGTLMLDGSQDPLATEFPEVRFVIWLAPISRLAKVGTNTLLIQRVVPNPEVAREEMRAFLKSKRYRFTGNLYLNVKVRDFTEYEQLMKHIQSHGSLLMKQTVDWDQKSLRFSFSQQKSKKNLRKAQLFFTPARDLAKEDWKKFDSTIWSQKPGAAELPAFYLEVIKYGDLSIYPGKPEEELERKISQSALRVLEEKIKETKPPPPQEVADTMVDVGEGLYLETTHEKLTSYLSRPTVRGYYQGILPMYAADEKVPVKDGHFEIQIEEPTVRPETRLQLGEDQKNRPFTFTAEPKSANDFTISGSVLKNGIGINSVLTWIQAKHWLERPFGVARISPFFQNVGLSANYQQMTNFFEQEDFEVMGVGVNFRYLHEIHSPANGLIVGLVTESLDSGQFQGGLAGFNLSYEAELPFPLFEDWPKTIEALMKFHFWGPSLEVHKSMIYGLRGKMLVSPGFYLHGGVQKFESSIEHVELQKKFTANILLVDGGFGFKF